MSYRVSVINRVASGGSAALMLAALSLAGCMTVGPDYMQPEPPVATGYTAQPLSGQTVATPSQALGGSQRFVTGQVVSAHWWENFGSPSLNALIEQALQASPTLIAAQATLRQAQQSYAASAGSSLYPQVNADLGAKRQRTNNSSFGQSGGEHIFNLYNAGVIVSYNFDLFGGNRRALEALAAQADYQRYQLEGARQTLAANIVTAAMAQAQYAAQIQATEAILAEQQAQVDIAHKRFELGAIARGDELSLVTQMEQIRASLPPLRNALQQTNHLLAVLAGQAPGAAKLPSFQLSDFTLPAEVPVLVPSELVRQRPDIQASEALLRSANAEYGVAISKLYPQINLSAALGASALTTSSLFGPGTQIWSLASQLAQPLFNGGLKAGANSAQAGLDAAAANYQETVLQGLRNVADSLRALDNGAQTLQAQAAANAAAEIAFNLIQEQYQLGGVSYLQLLIVQLQLQQTRVNLIAAQSQLLSNTAALYQAMGGGWVNEAAPTTPSLID
jgi:NodT family efflux transporter outer membrane factor (OMF) lipoprotein